MNMMQINQAVTLLKQGGLVAFPTETVYGLGADARNPMALEKIFAVKGRPKDHPLIVHIADFSQVNEWAVGVSADAVKLAQAFWPGPLTLIFKRSKSVSDLVTGNQVTVGLRIPQHPIAQTLLQGFGGGIAAPSANRFGRISPTTAAAVREELGTDVDLILDGGACDVGVESTIVDVSHSEPIVLRPGMITVEEIAKVLGKSIASHRQDAPRVSGSMHSHYAPRTPAILIPTNELQPYLELLTEEQFPLVCMSYHEPVCERKNLHWHKMPIDAHAYAHDLYQALRALDHQNFKAIVIEAVPETSEWLAIRDRLQRATNKSL